MEDKTRKTKDPFSSDVMDDVISSQMRERDARREKQRERKRREEEKKQIAEKNKESRRKVYIAVIAVLVLVGAMFSKSLIQIVELKAEKEEAQAKLNALNDHIARLNEQLSRVTSKEYIEQQARQQLRMIYPGEVLYIVLDK